MEVAVEQYSDIILTDEEIAEGLRQLRKEKWHLQNRIKYHQKITQEPVYLKLECEKSKQYAVKRFFELENKEFKIDNDNIELFTKLCLYFSNDTEFEKGEFNLDKGLMLQGAVGVGKTAIMKMFNQNSHQSYAVVPCRKIADQFSAGGDFGKDEFEGIERYSTIPKKTFGYDPFGFTDLGFCFDDLGTETIPSKHYGRDKNVMAEILLNRYDKGIPFSMTHVTTNLTIKQIEDIYGSRVKDRILESFNILHFKTTKSRR